MDRIGVFMTQLVNDFPDLFVLFVGYSFSDNPFETARCFNGGLSLTSKAGLTPEHPVFSYRRFCHSTSAAHAGPY